MEIKRTLVGIFSAFLIVIFGIGLFTPSCARAAVYQNKICIDIQSCTDGNYDYLLSTYSDYSAEIEISAHRDINTVYNTRVATPTSKIYLTILAYETNYQNWSYWNKVIEDNSEVLRGNFTENTSFRKGERVCTLKLTPLETNSQYYDPSFIKIGGHIFKPILLENRTPQYTPVLDLNGDGVFNVEDSQFLLRFYLESCILNNYTVSPESLNAFKTEYWRERHDVL